MQQHPPIQQADMARNIEIKTRIDSVEAMAVKAAALADSGPNYLTQNNESPESGMDIAQKLMTQLGLEPAQLVDEAYVDLLAMR